MLQMQQKKRFLALKKINTEGGAKLAFFKYYVFILFFTGGISDLLSGTGKSEKSDTVSGKLRFFICGGSQNTVCCSFFLLQPAIWVEDASNIRDRRSVSVLLIRQTDPEIQGWT